MFNWDDVRIFLAAARSGTVRGAARQLDVTHATVSRRLRGLEGSLGSRLFERTSGGQVLSSVGGSILAVAEQIEKGMEEIDRLTFAQDQRLAGAVRLSITESLYLTLVHPFLERFQEQFPMIEVELISTERLTNLHRREADIVVRITKKPPDSAYGKKIAARPLACFGSRRYLERRSSSDRWIEWTCAPAAPLPAQRILTVDSVMIAAQLIRNGQGIGMLPCYLGDGDPELFRVPNTGSVPDMDVWVLVHDDMRSVPRVRVLLDHLYSSLEGCRDLLEGRRPAVLD